MIEKVVLEQIKQDQQLKKLLDNCPFRIIQEMEVVRFDNAGDFLLRQDERHEYVYIILEGEFEIYRLDGPNRRMILDQYDQRGTFIGEQEAILDLPYSSSVCNLGPCQLIRMTCQNFLDWTKNDVNFLQNLLKNQCEQVYHLTLQAAYYTLHSAKEQIARCLLNAHDRNKVVTKSDLQRLVSTSNRHVNRILSDLVAKEIIQLNQSTIRILKPKDLLYYGED